MFEQFTDRARRVLVLAQEEARLLNHNFIGTEHILLGLIHEGEGVAAKALESLGISLEAVRQKVAETIGPASTAGTGSPPFTPRAKKVLELSLREALQLGHNYIGTEHMLLGLIREGEGVAPQVLVNLGADLSQVRQQVIQLLSGYSGEEWFAAVSGEDVAPAELPIEPALLLTWDDVEALLGEGPFLESTTTRSDKAAGVDYRTSRFQPRLLPSVWVSVAGAEVTVQAFDKYTEHWSGSGGWSRVQELGDAATYSESTGSLRVLSGTTLFVVRVRDHGNPREAAIRLARKALERLASER